MDIGTLKKAIHDKKLGHLYVFMGDEVKAQDIYIAKIAEVTGKPVEHIDLVTDAFRPRGLFSTSSTFVCLDDKQFQKAFTNVESIENLLGDNILIVRYSELDKRTKFAKAVADISVEFGRIDDNVLIKYMRKQIDLTPTGCKRLIDVCDGDYSRILMEIDKLKAYGGNPDIALVTLLSDGTIYTPAEDAIFKFTDAVLMHDRVNAFRLLEQCELIGEPPLRLLSVLYTNIRRVLQVQACNSRNVSDVTGLSQWDVKLGQEKSGYWEMGDLVWMMKLIHKLEDKLKRGDLEESMAMTVFMGGAFL